MKKNFTYLSIVLLALLACSKVSFSQTAASATWALSTDKTVATTGTVTTENQVLGALTDRTYSSAIGFFGGGWQRLTSTSDHTATSAPTDGSTPVTSPSLPFVTGGIPDYTHYAEFKVTSSAALYTKVNTFQISALGGGTGNGRIVVLYSLDNFATAGLPMPSAGAYNDLTYAATESAPVVLLNTSTAGNGTTTAASKTIGQATLTFTSINKVLSPNQTFTVRVFPFLSSASATSPRYFPSQNASIIATTAVSADLLPLDFLSFTVKPDAFGKTVALNWATTNEVNTKNFEIQRRTDGTDFVTIKTLASKNTAGVHNYSYTDNSAVAGNSYYRIVQFDNDGASTISDIKAVTTTASASFSVYPNPASSVLNVSHDAAQAGSSVKVISTDGKTVIQQALGLNSTDTKLDVSQLNVGNYILILDNGNQQSSLKFIKQ